ncbi:MAG: hypothetical protein CMP73_04090 [Flavobacteriales bacterium]|nr:hypothetical protein [Flavobacteriales bacterium]
MKVVSKISNISGLWNLKGMPFYLKSEFISSFYKNHCNFKHLFIYSDTFRIYAQVFNLRIDKTSNYSKSKIFVYLLSLLKTDVLYLSNSFFTNRPSFFNINDKLNINEILSDYKCRTFMIVIPDTLMSNFSENSKKNFKRIEVEEDMVLSIHPKWINFDDYKNALKTKYRKKIKLILNRSCDIIVKDLGLNEIKLHSKEIQKLFNQVVEKSRFRGPFFNTETLIDLFEKQIVKIFGYYLNDKIVAFSSEIHEDDCLYSYYVGFDKKLNNKYFLYGRILVETIKHSIDSNRSTIVFGRTANEYKSNFGAKPIKSYFYVRIRNNFLSYLFFPFLKYIKIPTWKQRNPFKNKN